MDKNKKSVLVPIIFFKHYNWPLSIRELRRYLWQMELSEGEIEAIVKTLPKLNYQEGKIWLGNLDPKLPERIKLIKVFWQKVKKWRWIFSNVPFLSRAFVSNTLAFGTIDQNSDIDLFLVGKPGRLWTTRAFLLTWFNLFGLRVRSANRQAKFSPEFFISETVTNLQPLLFNDDYYFAFWLADLISIWPDNTQGKFWVANNWNKSNLPIAWRSPKRQPVVPLRGSAFKWLLEKILEGRFGDQLENWLKLRQEKIIMRTNERLGINPSIVMSSDMIKLHFNDRRVSISEEIEQVLAEFGEVKVEA